MADACRFQGEHKLKRHYVGLGPVQNLFYLAKYTFLICKMGLRGDDFLGPFQGLMSPPGFNVFSRVLILNALTLGLSPTHQ